MKHWAFRAIRGTGLGVVAEVLARAANTIFFVLLTWHLGRVEASTYSVGFVYSSFLIFFALGGIEQLLNREVSRDHSQGTRFLGSFLFARMVASTLCYLGLLVWVRSFTSYDPHVADVILVLGATLIPESLLNLFQSFLIARDRVGTITLFSALTGGFKLGLGVLAIVLGGDALALAGVVLVTSLISVLLYTGFVVRTYGWPVISLDPQFWLTNGRAALPLFVLAIMATIEVSFDALLLSRGGGNDVVVLGTYNAAGVVLTMLLLLPQSYRQIILALLAGSYHTARERAWQIYLQSKRVLLNLALLASLSVTLVADQLLAILFRNEFAAAVPVLQVLVWSFFLTTLLVPNGRLILVAGRQSVLVPFQLASMALNIGLNLALQPLLAAQGAAIARVASTGLILILCLSYVRRQIYAWRIWPLLRPALGAGFACWLVVAGMRWLGVYWILALGCGWVVYVLVFVVLGGVSVAELRDLGALLRRGRARLRLLVRGA